MQRFKGHLVALLLVLTGPTACVTTSTSGGSSIGGVASTSSGASSRGDMTGDATPRGVVELFMAGVKEQNLQKMSVAWGTAKGPARDQIDREELEKRLIVIQCMLAHDSWKFAEDEARLQAGGRREFVVEVRKRELRARTSFTTIQGPANRWYVEIVDIEPLREFCR